MSAPIFHLALRGLVFSTVSFFCFTPASADELADFARACDVATQLTVPAFDCSAGTEVPLTHPNPPNGVYGNLTCDEPNRLNRECDPGSKFQVLQRTNQGFVVGHCRNQGGNPARFGDIAVIQHNTQNGATCFYQALPAYSQVTSVQSPQLPDHVPSPSAGAGNPKFWMQPSEIAHSSFQCVSCHDNGAIVRSPYLAQLAVGKDALPGATDSSFNGASKPYRFVGPQFAHWKAYSVKIQGNACLGCHRLGVNNQALAGGGTAIDFGLRATSPTPEHGKNPYTDDGNPATMESHIWMPPGRAFFDQPMRSAAEQVADCARRISAQPLPSDPSCTIEEYAGPWEQTASPGIGPVLSAITAYELYPGAMRVRPVGRPGPLPANISHYEINH